MPTFAFCEIRLPRQKCDHDHQRDYDTQGRQRKAKEALEFGPLELPKLPALRIGEEAAGATPQQNR